MASLLDTNVAVDLIEGDDAAWERFLSLPNIPFLSMVSKVELDGIVLADPAARQRRRIVVDALLGT